MYGPYGGSRYGRGDPWVSTRPDCKLSYLSGISGSRLDSITLHYECPLVGLVEDGPYGGSRSGAWTDGNGVSANGHVTAIELRSGSEIDAIRARY